MALEYAAQQLVRAADVAALVHQEDGLRDVVARLERIDPAGAFEQLQRLVAPCGILVQHRREARIALRGVRAQLEALPIVGLGRGQVVECGQVRALQIGVAVLGVERKRALDQLAALAQRALEPLGPVVGDFVLRDEELRMRRG